MIERNVNVRAMKTKLADLWRPAIGINIKKIQQGIFLFSFYHKEDMNWVLRGGSWSFDNTMLVFKVVPKEEEPRNVPMWHVNIWIQIYDLPTGFMIKAVSQQLGNFFG